MEAQLRLGSHSSDAPFQNWPWLHSDVEQYAGWPPDGCSWLVRKLVGMLVGLAAMSMPLVGQEIVRRVGWSGCERFTVGGSRAELH